jgi:hypothetical protein
MYRTEVSSSTVQRERLALDKSDNIKCPVPEACVVRGSCSATCESAVAFSDRPRTVPCKLNKQEMLANAMP